MKPAADRLKASLLALVRAAVPTIDYMALYRAKVVSQSGDGRRLDLQPDDARLPGMREVPLRLGIPGATAKILPGAQVLVGWEGGDPARPFCEAFEGGETVLSLSVKALKLELGGEGLVPLLDGVLTGRTPCQFTGAPHAASGTGVSLVVLAKEKPTP